MGPATRTEVSQEGEDVVVKLHMNEIVRLGVSGDLKLSSGGWRNNGTMEAINSTLVDLVPTLNMEVVLAHDQWTLRDGNGNSVDFVDGIVIPTRSETPLCGVRTSGDASASNGSGATASSCQRHAAANAAHVAQGAVCMTSGGVSAANTMAGTFGAQGMASATMGQTPQQRMLMQMMMQQGGVNKAMMRPNGVACSVGSMGGGMPGGMVANLGNGMGLMGGMCGGGGAMGGCYGQQQMMSSMQQPQQQQLQQQQPQQQQLQQLQQQQMLLLQKQQQFATQQHTPR